MTPRRWLWLVILVHLGLGLMYAQATPPLEASDEGAHFGVVQWLVQGRGLPVQEVTEPRRETYYHQEGSQPPLYYVLAAGLTAGMPAGDHAVLAVPNPLSRVGFVGARHNVNLYRPAPPTATGETARAVGVIRLFSLGLSCVTLWLTYHLARRMFGREGPALAATALAGFNPMALFINASVNNDNLLMLLSTLTLLLGLRLMDRPPTRKDLAGLGLVLGLAALTKISGLVLWPIAALAVVWGARQELGARWWPWPAGWAARVAGRLALVFLVAGAVCGWWFVRNLFLYGEVLGLETMVTVAGRRTVEVWTVLTEEWYGFHRSYWGVFGVFTLLPSLAAQRLADVLTLGGAAGLVVWWVQRRGRVPFAGAWLALFCALTLAGVISWTLRTPASQGRLLFGALAPLSMGLTLGWLTLAGGRTPAVGALTAVLGLSAAVIPVADIAPQYQPPRPVTEADLPADLQMVRARLGEGIELIGYQVGSAPVTPGAEVPITLYWRALAPMTTDDALALVVFGRDDVSLGQIDSWPGRGLLPTSFWQTGAVYADQYWLPTRPEADTPTRLILRLGLWRDAPENRLPIHLPDGAVVEAVSLKVGRLLGPAPALPAGQVATTFEHGLTLLAYAVEAGPAARTLTLYWQSTGPIPADYTLFVHVLDGAGRQIDQADGPPLSGDWPTSAWEPGQAFVERRTIPWPAAPAADCCVVALGWYDPETGVRLAATRADGAAWPENAVLIPAP